MRPIDHKLKHQIDKLVKTAATGATGGSDPTHFRAHPENMVSKGEEESEESESEGEDDKEDNKQRNVKKGVYVPPKLAAVHYGK